MMSCHKPQVIVAHTSWTVYSELWMGEGDLCEVGRGCSLRHILNDAKVARNKVIQDMLMGCYLLWKTLYLNFQCHIYKYDYIWSDTYNIGCSPHFSINLFGILVQGHNSACSKPNGQFKPILNSPTRHQVFMLNQGILSTGFWFQALTLFPHLAPPCWLLACGGGVATTHSMPLVHSPIELLMTWKCKCKCAF